MKDLGSARAGLNQTEQAEADLIEAHTILVTVRGEQHADTLACAQAIADFYQAWDKSQPGKGHTETAARWLARVDSTGTPSVAEGKIP